MQINNGEIDADSYRVHKWKDPAQVVLSGLLREEDALRPLAPFVSEFWSGSKTLQVLLICSCSLVNPEMSQWSRFHSAVKDRLQVRWNQQNATGGPCALCIFSWYTDHNKQPNSEMNSWVRKLKYEIYFDSWVHGMTALQGHETNYITYCSFWKIG